MSIKSIVFGGDDIENRPPIFSIGRDLRVNVNTNSSGQVTAINIVNGGVGYKAYDRFSIDSPGSPSSKALFRVSLTDSNGKALSIVTSPFPAGAGYTPSLTNSAARLTKLLEVETVEYNNSLKTLWSGSKKINAVRIFSNLSGPAENRTYIAVGDSAQVARSTNFTTWTNLTSNLSSTGWGTSNITSMLLYDPYQFLILGGQSSKVASSVDNGSSWSYINTLFNREDWGPSVDIMSIIWANDTRFYYLGSNGKIAGSNTFDPTVISVFYEGLSNNSNFNSGGTKLLPLMNLGYVVIGKNGNYAYTTNFISWTVLNIGIDEDITDIAPMFFNDRFFIFTELGKMFVVEPQNNFKLTQIDSRFNGSSIKALRTEQDLTLYIVSPSSNYISVAENLLDADTNWINGTSPLQKIDKYLTVSTLFPDNGWPNTVNINNIFGNALRWSNSNNYPGFEENDYEVIVTSNSGDIAKYRMSKFAQ